MSELVHVPQLDLSLVGDQLPTGPNAGSRTLTRAASDIDAVSDWLAQYTQSPNTFDSYRRETERLLAWCADRRQRLAEILAADVVEYVSFLSDPQPREKWCMQQEPRWLADGSQNPAWRSMRRVPQRLADGALNPEWRPFVSGLSDSAVAQARTIIFGLFEYLCATGYLASNPLRATRGRRASSRVKNVERYLDRDTWQTLLQHLEAWPRVSARDISHYERSRFLVEFLYLTGLRRAEIAGATTKMIHVERGRWWLKITGKGGVTADIPLPADALAALRRYRESTGRPGLPSPAIDEPLLMDICAKGRPLTVKAVAHIMKSIFESAADSCENPYQAETLRAASTHWLRHTAATHQLDAGIPLLVVRDNLRHASVQTTERYLHVERATQHQETEKHKI